MVNKREFMPQRAQLSWFPANTLRSKVRRGIRIRRRVVSSILVHEVWHLLRKHHQRAARLGINESNALDWNIATDCEINDDLVAQGGTLSDCLLPSHFGFRLRRLLLRRLPRRRPTAQTKKLAVLVPESAPNPIILKSKKCL
jgi:hypothetical protein